MKNTVRLVGAGLLVVGQLACGGEVEGVEEAQPESQPAMSELHVSKNGMRVTPETKAPEAQPGRVHQLGPAPNLTSVQVIAVCSEAFYNTYAPYDCEDVTAVSTTGFNHGGAWMVTITKEMGYRAWHTSTLGGYAMSEYYNDPILNIYNEMIGWYRYWETTNGQQSGLFKYTAASINTYTQYSDQVTVQ
ncbi:DUF4879 domain-containing protein [Pyxidicoccus trucidator]|uniref:DUF4879 domain-containing protein n=1 Tax=Pyxidicoccus trucidator TaxID=2709662 RepID=UPI0013DB9969|nr:DUF4879 domain-containing protein [Pyxidicoccus trucidator]